MILYAFYICCRKLGNKCVPAQYTASFLYLSLTVAHEDSGMRLWKQETNAGGSRLSAGGQKCSMHRGEGVKITSFIFPSHFVMRTGDRDSE